MITKAKIKEALQAYQANNPLYPSIALVAFEDGMKAAAALTKPKKNSSIEGLELPAWLPQEVWNSWDDFRKAMKNKPWTRRAAELNIGRLVEYRKEGHDPVKVIELAIERGWQGLIANDQTLARPAATRNLSAPGDRGPNGRPLAPHEIPRAPRQTFVQEANQRNIQGFLQRTSGPPDLDDDIMDGHII